MTLACAVVVGAVVSALAGCSDDGDGDGDGDDGDDGRGGLSDVSAFEFEPTGDLVAEVEGVGAVYAGTVRDLDEVEVRLAEATVEPPVELTREALAVGRGLSAEVSSGFSGRFEVRLQLPPAPSSDAVPVAIHLHDGEAEVEPGLLDEATNQLVVTTNEFSDRWGVWYDSRNWAEEAFQGVQGGFDFVADFITGRTDPPRCGNNAPRWGSVRTEELSSLHVCSQLNKDPDGTDRFELYLASNRRTAQIVTVPANAKDYLWVENQPDWFNKAMSYAFGVDGETNVVLLGTHAMSMGFRRPQFSETFRLRSYQTWQATVSNVLFGMADKVPTHGLLALSLAASKCTSEFSGIDVRRLDLVPDGYDSPAEFLEQLVRCAWEAIQEPELIEGLAREALGAGGITGPAAAGIVDGVANQAARLKSIASKFAVALAVAQGGTLLWDEVFDHKAAGLVRGQLTGTLDDRALLGLATCKRNCVVTGNIAVDHPTWGPVHVITVGPGPDGASCSGADVMVIDGAGEVRWQRSIDPTACYYLLAPAGTARYGSRIGSPVDEDGRVFLDYNPGRYNGVIVLSMVDGGVDDHRSMPTSENYDMRWYYAEVVDSDHDGTYEIEESYNDCVPSCAGGTVSSFVHRWEGDDFEPVPPSSPIACGGLTIDFDLADEIYELTAVDIICPDAFEAADQIGKARAPYAGTGNFDVGDWHCTVAVPDYIERYSCTGPGAITFARNIGTGD